LDKEEAMLKKLRKEVDTGEQKIRIYGYTDIRIYEGEEIGEGGGEKEEKAREEGRHLLVRALESLWQVEPVLVPEL